MAGLVQLIFLEGSVAGIVIGLRSKRLVPGSLLAAFACIAFGLLLPIFALPLLHIATTLVSLSVALQITVLPLLAATFLLIALGLRGLVGTMHPGVR
jgi:hypothetical protein